MQCAISAKFGVVVFKAYMFNCLGGLICYGYMCIVLYVKVIWCDGFPEIYARLEEEVESICHGCMCIVVYLLDLSSFV